MPQYDISKTKYVDRNNDLFDVFMMADKDGNILNSFGVSANIPIAAGLVEGWSTEHKFGAVPSMSQSNTGTVWDKDDTLYPWDALDTHGFICKHKSS